MQEHFDRRRDGQPVRRRPPGRRPGHRQRRRTARKRAGTRGWPRAGSDRRHPRRCRPAHLRPPHLGGRRRGRSHSGHHRGTDPGAAGGSRQPAGSPGGRLDLWTTHHPAGRGPGHRDRAGLRPHGRDHGREPGHVASGGHRARSGAYSPRASRGLLPGLRGDAPRRELRPRWHTAGGPGGRPRGRGQTHRHPGHRHPGRHDRGRPG